MVDFPAAALDRVGEAFDGRFGIYVEELNSGLSYGYCDNERFPAASVCKVTPCAVADRRSWTQPTTCWS